MVLRKKLKKHISIFSLTILFGCSYYSMAGSLPPDIDNVNIPLFTNETSEFEISEKITSNIVDEIAIQNILKIISDEKNSHSTILGKITNISDGPYSFDVNEQVSEYRFTLTVSIEWVDNISDKKLIEQNFTGFGTYSIDNDPSNDGIDNDNDGILDENDDDEFGDSRELAINIAINKIASDIVNSILSTW